MKEPNELIRARMGRTERQNHLTCAIIAIIFERSPWNKRQQKERWRQKRRSDQRSEFLRMLNEYKKKHTYIRRQEHQKEWRPMPLNNNNNNNNNEIHEHETKKKPRCRNETNKMKIHGVNPMWIFQSIFWNEKCVKKRRDMHIETQEKKQNMKERSREWCS